MDLEAWKICNVIYLRCEIHVQISLLSPLLVKISFPLLSCQSLTPLPVVTLQVTLLSKYMKGIIIL